MASHVISAVEQRLDMNRWVRLGMPSNMAKYLNFIMIHLTKYQPRLCEGSARRIFSNEGWENCHVEVFTLLETVNVHTPIRKLCQYLCALGEMASWEALTVRKHDAFTVTINGICFDIIFGVPSEVDFDVNSLMLDEHADISIRDNIVAHVVANHPETGPFISRVPLSVPEVIRACQTRQASIVWTAPDADQDSTDVRRLLEFMHKYKKLIGSGWKLNREYSAHFKLLIEKKLDEEETCCICQEPFEGEKTTVTLQCGHTLHHDCLDKLMSMVGTHTKKCPLDRSEIQPLSWKCDLRTVTCCMYTSDHDHVSDGPRGPPDVRDVQAIPIGNISPQRVSDFPGLQGSQGPVDNNARRVTQRRLVRRRAQVNIAATSSDDSNGDESIAMEQID